VWLVRHLGGSDFGCALWKFCSCHLLEELDSAPKVAVPDAFDDQTPCCAINLFELDEAPTSIAEMTKERFTKVPYAMKKGNTFIPYVVREYDRYTPSHSQAKLANTASQSWTHSTTALRAKIGSGPDVQVEAKPTWSSRLLSAADFPEADAVG
jgi:hypothetical protein